jgi:hypothetical protein
MLKKKAEVNKSTLFDSKDYTWSVRTLDLELDDIGCRCFVEGDSEDNEFEILDVTVGLAMLKPCFSVLVEAGGELFDIMTKEPKSFILNVKL